MSDHPEEAYVRADGIRDLTMEHHVRRIGGVVTINDREGPQVVQLNMSVEGLEFLLDHMPPRDGFTEQLRYAKKLVRFAAYHRLGGRA